jgi:hypothetical protein
VEAESSYYQKNIHSNTKLTNTLVLINTSKYIFKKKVNTKRTHSQKGAKMLTKTKQKGCGKT